MIKERQGDICICRIDGKVDTLTAPSLEKELLGVLDEGHTKVVLDVSKMTYVSSSGLRVFLLAYKKSQVGSVKLCILGLVDSLKTIMDVSGLTRFFCFVESMEDAIHFFDGGY